MRNFSWPGLAIVIAVLAGAVALSIYAGNTGKFAPKSTMESAPDCTGVSIVVDPRFISQVEAERAAGITTEKIQLTFYIWDSDSQRLELWLSDGVKIWQLEIVCFDKRDAHYPIYGEVQIVNYKDLAKKESAAGAAERR